MPIKMDEKNFYRLIIWGAGKFSGKMFEHYNYFFGKMLKIIGIADSNSVALNKKIRKGEIIFSNEIMREEFDYIYSADEVKNAR